MSFSFNKTIVASTAVFAPASEGATEGKTEAEVTNTATEGETIKAKAIALAKKESTEMSAAMTAVMKAKEDWQGGPIKVLFALKDAYGEELINFPEPDSDGGNTPDKFKVEVVDTSGKSAMRPTTFYTIFSDNTREGAAIVQELEWLKRAANTEAVKTGIPAEILDLSPQQRGVRENFLSGRRTTIRNSYKKAMALGLQLIAVNGVPGVIADFVYVTDREGNDTADVENTTKPIIVYVPRNDGKPVAKWEYFSIGSFLKLNPKKAIEKGGGFQALKDTVARATGGKTGNGEANAIPPIKTVDTFLGRFVEVFRFANEMQYDKSQKDMAQLYKLLKHNDAAELVVAMVEMEMFLSDANKALGLSKKYNELQKKGSDLTSSNKLADAA
jgi:hypothetical protein